MSKTRDVENDKTTIPYIAVRLQAQVVHFNLETTRATTSRGSP
jgi:hypothetical protein